MSDFRRNVEYTFHFVDVDDHKFVCPVNLEIDLIDIEPGMNVTFTPSISEGGTINKYSEVLIECEQPGIIRIKGKDLI